MFRFARFGVSLTVLVSCVGSEMFIGVICVFSLVSGYFLSACRQRWKADQARKKDKYGNTDACQPQQAGSPAPNSNTEAAQGEPKVDMVQIGVRDQSKQKPIRKKLAKRRTKNGSGTLSKSGKPKQKTSRPTQKAITATRHRPA